MRSKALAFILVLLFMVQMIPLNIDYSYAAGEVDNKLSVYTTSGVPSDPVTGDTPNISTSGLHSYIRISSGSATILPNGAGDYENIPAGANIELQYAFALSDGIEESGDTFSYVTGESFTIRLPKGLSFTATSGSIKRGNTSVNMATWEIETIGADNVLKITLSDGVEDQNEIWGKLNIEGTFKLLTVSDPIQTEAIFGTQTIKIGRQPPDTQSSINKSGSYNPSTNAITWTVTINPPKADQEINYLDYSVEDMFSDNQTYVPESFRVQNGTSPVAVISDSNITSSSSVNYTTISYKFPAATKGPQTITYQTKPKSFQGPSGASTFDNTVTLKDPSDSIVGGPNTANVILDWIDKTGGPTLITGDDIDVVKWTIKIKVPGVTDGAITDAKIIDSLPEYLELIEDANHKVTIKFGTGAATVVSSGTGIGQYDYDKAGGKLTYVFDNGNQPKVGTDTELTFYTRLKADKREGFYNTNGVKNFSNTAKLEWNVEVDEDKFPSDSYTTKGSGSGLGVNSGGLLFKIGTGSVDNYKYLNTDIIEWKITVNRNKINMLNARIFDEIPMGQDLLIETGYPFIVTEMDSGVKLFEASNGDTTVDFVCTNSGLQPHNFLFKFTNNITSSYAITYYTKITNRENLYSNNKRVGFENKATLTRDEYPDISIKGTKYFNSQMLGKDVITEYDYGNGLVQWQVLVNRNQLPITSASVTDTLPDGMTMVNTLEHPFEVIASTGTATGTAIIYTTGYAVDLLPDNNSNEYTIKFWTKIDESLLSTQWSGDKIFENKAKLTIDGYIFEASAVSRIKNPVIFKSGQIGGGTLYPDGNSDTIYWSIIINNAEMKLIDAEVSDTLPPSLVLDEGSVKLYEVGITTKTGIYNPGMTSNAATGWTSSTSISGENNILKIKLPNGKQAYLLEFATTVKDEALENVVNTVALTGDTSSPTGYTTSNAISINNLYTIAGSGTNSLIVNKTDDKDNPLYGAKFSLLNIHKSPVSRSGGLKIEVTTDSDGKAVFNSLPGWTYFVKEIEPPIGYLIPTSTTGAPVYYYGEKLDGHKALDPVKNKLAFTSVTLNKVGANGVLLNGGLFKLTGYDYKSSPVAITATAVNGKVIFTGVPLPEKDGTNYTKYSINEIEAPVGHVINTTTVTATVLYNTQFTSLVVTPTLKMENVPEVIDVSFTKRGFDDKLISGGSFTLSGTDYKNKLVNGTATAVNGVVSFSDLLPNKTGFPYIITEVQPPDGYLRPIAPIILTVEVTYNATKTGLIQTIRKDGLVVLADEGYTNTKALGVITFNKLKAADSTSLAGATFKLTGNDYAGLPVNMFAVSTTGGTVTFKGVPIDDGNKYTIKETSAPPGYKLTATQLEATVRYVGNSTSAATTTVVTYVSPSSISNELAPKGTLYARVTVKKTDDKTNLLAGAVFGLYNKTLGISLTAISNSKGIVDFGTVPVGPGYTLEEVKAPDGYIRDGTSKTFSLDTKGQEFTVVNTKNPDGFGRLSILKTDDKAAVLGGAEFTLYDSSNNAVATVVTKKDGTAVFTKLPPGNYTVKETLAPFGYVALGNATNVVITTDASLSLSFENKKNEEITPGATTAKILIAKVNKEKQPLEGAVFTLYDSLGYAIGKAVSGSDGMVAFNGLAPGKYTVKETVAPDGYKLFDGSLAVVIGSGGGTFSYTLTDSEVTDAEDSGVAGWTDSGLPTTGGIDWNFHMTLIGLCFLLLGLILAKPRRRAKGSNKV